MGDGNLEMGWYRFNSSGGWKIPESVIPHSRCSGEHSGWLNGPHPNVGAGEVTRTVCFTGPQYTCYWRREIKVKNCSGYFVYWLWNAPSSNAVYCTEPMSDTSRERQGLVTGEPGPGLTTSPAGSVSSDLEASTLEQSTGLSTGEHTQELSSVPAGDTSSDLEVSTMDQPDGSSTGQPTPSPSSVSVGETSSDLEVSTMDQPDESSTGQPTPSPSSVSMGETSSVTDSTLGDPCVTHTVLDQSWRSTNCYHTECTGGQWMSDGNLEVRWYRFNSSGGWKIPETVVPQGRCSGETPGWLNGSHPNVGEGEVTRTVCFTVGEDTCYQSLEIKVKNCSGYFVYWLKPTPRQHAVYCTDSLLDTTWEPQGSTTGEPALGLTTTAAGSVSSDLEVSTMDQPDGSSTGQPTPSPSSVSAGETSSDPQSDTSQEPQGSVTGGPGPGLSTTPAGSASSDPGTSTRKQSEGSSTGDFSQETLSVPAGDTSSGSSTGKQTNGSVSGEHTQKSSSVPAGDTSPGPGSSTGKQSEGSSTGDFSQETSSVPARDTASGERMWIKVQLTSSGVMSEDEVWEATRQKIWELFGDPNLQIKLVRFRAKPSEE
ncbi:mucin-5AC-like isoform X2 [Mobula hypostoma]|uniref:mucin-5AC-like isoform X2 n=1 Tax=Mobula hypostoma TaxID=723540 RepID=UPI002FC30129